MRCPPGVKTPSKQPLLSQDEVAAVKAMIIGQDRRVIAFDKPSGLSSQGGRGQANTLDELVYALQAHGERPRLVHRLDRDTSGVILAAKTRAAAGFLGKAIQNRRVEKTYLALVAPGAPSPPDGEIATALRREEIGREAYMRPCDANHSNAEAALTRYRTLASTAFASLVELKPVTGRMHQLRVHLASIGRPILGDVRYGGALVIDGSAAPRLMLHAIEFGFPHPEGGFARARAAPPQDFAALAAALGISLAAGATGLFRDAAAPLEPAE